LQGEFVHDSVLDLRREVLRLAKIQDRAVCLRIPQLAAFYNLTERRVREEFADLAEKKLIRLSSWDGKQFARHLELVEPSRIRPVYL